MSDSLFTYADKMREQASPKTPDPSQSEEPPQSAPQNEPLSVSELAQQVKRTVEQNFRKIRVRGELSRVTHHRSGHVYTDLKDENSVINAVCWRGTVNKLPLRPEEGLDVICTGKLSTYPARSNYQLVIDHMELAGEGALLKMLEERKKRLMAQGLFAPERKKNLPFLPEVIGVISSPTGAVIRDILHRLTDRFPRPALLWPANMQGENCVRDVTTALEHFSTMPTQAGDLDPNKPYLRRPDVLIIARGGGSLEDLMPFNDEAIVRAVANCPIPIISAIGHETDTTLCDLAADRRAPTPTGAAEMAVPVRDDLIYTVGTMAQRMHHALRSRTQHHRSRLETLAARLGDPMMMVGPHRQKLDHLTDRLGRALPQRIERGRASLNHLGARLPHPRHHLMLQRQRLAALSQNLSPQRLQQRLSQDRETLAQLGRLLETVSYQGVLKRGFALATASDGSVIKSAKSARDQSALTLKFHDGDLDVKA